MQSHPVPLAETGSWGWAWSWPLAFPLNIGFAIGLRFPLERCLANGRFGLGLDLGLLFCYRGSHMPTEGFPIDLCLNDCMLVIDVWSCKDGKQVALVTKIAIVENHMAGKLIWSES